MLTRGATHLAFLGKFSSENQDETREWERPVSEVHLAPIRPRWTTEPPTHPGVFWIRLPGHSGRVVEVYADDHGRLSYSWTDVDPTPVPRQGLLWSDRSIVEPVD